MERGGAREAMKRRLIACFGVLTVLGSEAVFSATVPLDMRDVRPGPATVTAVEEGVEVVWPDETGREWRATFSLDPDQPLIESIAVGDAVVVSQVRPFYQAETGTRPARVERLLRLSAQSSRRHPARPGGVAACARRPPARSASGSN